LRQKKILFLFLFALRIAASLAVHRRAGQPQRVLAVFEQRSMQIEALKKLDKEDLSELVSILSAYRRPAVICH
jgi:hypothetical protein